MLTNQYKFYGTLSHKQEMESFMAKAKRTQNEYSTKKKNILAPHKSNR